MTVQCSETNSPPDTHRSGASYISILANDIARSWNALDVQIAWLESHPHQCAFVGDDSPVSPDIDHALTRCADEAKPLRFLHNGSHSQAIPIQVFGRSVGSICCLTGSDLTSHAEAMLTVFVDHVEQAHQLRQQDTELAELSQHLAQTYEELNLVYKLSTQLKVTDDPHAYFQHFSDELAETISAGTLIIFFQSQPDADDTDLLFVAGDDNIEHQRLANIARYLLRTRLDGTEPMIIPNAADDTALADLLGRNAGSVIAAPLRTAEKTVGVIIGIEKSTAASFDSADAKLLNSIGEQVAGVLHNRMLVKDLQDLLIGLLTSLVSAIDAKDPYTRGHSQRVALIGMHIAQTMQLAQQQIAEVYLTGLLHDVGKIGVDEAVLSKPGTLTAEEFDDIKQHPIIGARIISGITQLRSVAPAVLYHHERYDGSGYPHSLVGEQIPTIAAIVALADCFDAITSDRTYHSALDFTEALKHVTELAGKDFSPAVTEAFAQCDMEQLVSQLNETASCDRGIDLLPTLHLPH